MATASKTKELSFGEKVSYGLGDLASNFYMDDFK